METKNYLGELWVNIRGFEGLYQVSNFGRVRSLDRVVIRSDGRKYIYRGRIMKQQLAKGYCIVELSNGNRNVKRIVRYVHLLVAEAFIPNPKHLPEVNHKDENKLNNRLSNLERCTEKYNNNYGTRLERALSTKKKNMKRNKPILQYTLEHVFVKRWAGGSTEAADTLGYSQAHISDCCRGKRNQHKGYLWMFENAS